MTQETTLDRSPDSSAKKSNGRISMHDRIENALQSVWRRIRAVGRRPQGWVAVALAACGPIFAVLTFAAMTSGAAGRFWFQILLIIDILYLFVAIGLIGRQIARLIIARRKQSAGSRLHLRMVAIFAGVAAAPALMVAVFFFLVIQLGFDAWFNNQVGSVVRNSQNIARAYAREHREAITSQALALANELNAAGERFFGEAADPRFQLFVERATEGASFSDVYVLNSNGRIVAQGVNSYLFTFTAPSLDDFAETQSGEIVIKEDRAANEMRGLMRLDGLFDAYLYVSRPVDGAVLASLEQTSKGVQLYERLEANRGLWMARFAAIYLGFAVLILLAAIYLGLWFAERLARPIGRLAGAAERVRAGDLTVHVKAERGEDELSLLSKAFNRMTTEVRRKQEALSVAKTKSEERRLFSEAVLASVSSGVVALDFEGRIGLMNQSAAQLLGLDPRMVVGAFFAEKAPQFRAMVAEAIAAGDQPEAHAGSEKPIRIVRDNTEYEVLARITIRRAAPTHDDDEIDDAVLSRMTHGFVLTLDDTTDLVQAQRLAAWGDVARRIAHEIKNPLTPIQLAAERLRRKFATQLGEDSQIFERYTDTIIRQTGDIGRMVDAFVRFAKMPSPRMSVKKLEDIVREAVLLQEEARAHIMYKTAIADGGPFWVRADRGQLTQAFTNLLQNASDALLTRVNQEKADGREGDPPEIRVKLERKPDGGLAVLFEDNGIGLPIKDRRRLLEPYITTREKGAGLGLAIVAKIIEEHAGGFELGDARPFNADAEHSGRVGAAVRVELPEARNEARKGERDEEESRDDDSGPFFERDKATTA